ncbi:ligase-associated DNA damage response endonuclease PdeM [Bdellovibrio sp. ZAP7]|uniref:ligase-associated DNA damage response endonuclease PdeM n=1 Tax=Bdellovibrio sp. ZAP7 TaxID=2231053 RepID=UPI001159E99D|nr:ligase-associated DNA damage response endonuclease PdeM [Bdellovibrio sp. ZAP7]QDK45678.1 ligase-associated DNA damage response endonuclease PdeM [Bdellovibrio sp. ZAP7]
MIIQAAQQNIELLPEKAFLWRSENLLGLSDLHLGKAESYQFAGVPMPSGGHLADLDTLNQLIHYYAVHRVVILGDWIHNKYSLSEIVVRDLNSFFAAHRNIEWTLLLGNHETGSHDILRNMPFHFVEEELQMGPFLMTHGHKNPDTDLFQIQGHTHPLVNINQGALRLKLPCFVLEKKALTIPAFGSMTGGYAVKPGPNKRIFAIGNREIFEVE